MIHTDSDEGPVPVEVLQFEATKAKDADLGAARRELDALRELLEEALSIPAHGKGCQELRLVGPCDCWIARAREALEKTDG